MYTWGYPGLARSCRPQLRSCSSPGRCAWGSPCPWRPLGSCESCSGSRAPPSAPSARWICGRGCWTGCSRTCPGAPASSALRRCACEGSWCTRYGPSSGPPSWAGPAGKQQSNLLTFQWSFRYANKVIVTHSEWSGAGMSPKTRKSVSMLALPVLSSRSQRVFWMGFWLDAWNKVCG